MSTVIDVKPNKIIKLYRGDTFELYFDIPTWDYKEYQIKDNDNIYFGVMEPNTFFEDALIKKVYNEIVEEYETVNRIQIPINIYKPTGDIIAIKDDKNQIIKYCVKLTSEDTENVLPGIYYYSIKLHEEHLEDGKLIDRTRTVIKNTKFIILD